jgi:hypothetical protein
MGESKVHLPSRRVHLHDVVSERISHYDTRYFTGYYASSRLTTTRMYIGPGGRITSISSPPLSAGKLVLSPLLCLKSLDLLRASWVVNRGCLLVVAGHRLMVDCCRLLLAG